MKSLTFRFFIVSALLLSPFWFSGCRTSNNAAVSKKSLLGMETKNSKEFRKQVQSDPFPTANEIQVKK
jgi:hypothetical protein